MCDMSAINNIVSEPIQCDTPIRRRGRPQAPHSTHKTCTTCGTTAAIDAFAHTGRSKQCKACFNKRLSEKRTERLASEGYQGKERASKKMAVKTCRVCGLTASRDEFGGKGRSARCQECHNKHYSELVKNWRSVQSPQLKQARAERDALRSKRDFRWMLSALRHSVSSTKSRSRRSGMGHDITLEYLWDQWVKQDGKCYWLGVAMEEPSELSTRHPLMPSLDRIDSTKGYIKGNVVFSTYFANMAKSNCPPDEFVRCLNVVFGREQPKNPIVTPTEGVDIESLRKTKKRGARISK